MHRFAALALVASFAFAASVADAKKPSAPKAFCVYVHVVGGAATFTAARADSTSDKPLKCFVRESTAMRFAEDMNAGAKAVAK